MSAIRQQIIDAVETLLGAIEKNDTVTVEGEIYTFSATPATVESWRVVPLGAADLPAINVRDLEAAVTGEGQVGRLTHILPVAISIAAAGDGSVPIVRAMMQDVIKAIGSDYTLSGLVHRTFLVGHDLEVEQANQRLTVGTVSFDFHYRSKPYTL